MWKKTVAFRHRPSKHQGSGKEGPGAFVVRQGWGYSIPSSPEMALVFYFKPKRGQNIWILMGLWVGWCLLVSLSWILMACVLTLCFCCCVVFFCLSNCDILWQKMAACWKAPWIYITKRILGKHVTHVAQTVNQKLLQRVKKHIEVFGIAGISLSQKAPNKCQQTIRGLGEAKTFWILLGRTIHRWQRVVTKLHHPIWPLLPGNHGLGCKHMQLYVFSHGKGNSKKSEHDHYICVTSPCPSQSSHNAISGSPSSAISTWDG